MGRPKKSAAEKAPTKAASKKGSGDNGAHLGFEDKLWLAADKLRGSMDAAEYKHVVLGLVFLKYVSDAFEQRREAILKEEHADREDAEPIFWPSFGAREPDLLLALRNREKDHDALVLVEAKLHAASSTVDRPLGLSYSSAKEIDRVTRAIRSEVGLPAASQ